jgi:hypothetical protein
MHPARKAEIHILQRLGVLIKGGCKQLGKSDQEFPSEVDVGTNGNG